MGAIVAKYQGVEGADLPNFVKVSSQGDAGGAFWAEVSILFDRSEGTLPPFSVSGLDPAREQKRHDLRSFVEDRFAAERRARSRRCTARRTRPLAGSKRPGTHSRIDAEWSKYRDLYGDSEFGKRCLLARRLVESGVAFVEVGQSSYDSHADNFA